LAAASKSKRKVEVNMMKRMFRVCAMIAIAFAATQTALWAQSRHTVEGTWDVSVTVKNCQTGALIRTVRSLQMFSHDGSLTETANTFLRGSSLGTWGRIDANSYTTMYWFFRYNPDGTFKSFAEALNKIELSGDGSHFTASGTIQDYDATGNPLSLGCVSHAATRLAAPND
jgi:hypothetical protein